VCIWHAHGRNSADIGCAPALAVEAAITRRCFSFHCSTLPPRPAPPRPPLTPRTPAATAATLACVCACAYALYGLQIGRELQSLGLPLPTMPGLPNVNAGDLSLLASVLTAGLYPNVAYRSPGAVNFKTMGELFFQLKFLLQLCLRFVVVAGAGVGCSSSSLRCDARRARWQRRRSHLRRTDSCATRAPACLACMAHS
jgi:hypothetical protein